MTFLFHNASVANNAAYIALSAQLANQHRLDVTANNAANVNTTGFEEDKILVRSVPLLQPAGRTNYFAWAETTYQTNKTGALKTTNRPLDVGIAGDGYFKLMTPQGVRYSLDGNMHINNQNQLVNINGHRYLSADDAVIEIPENFQDLQISTQGAIFVDNEEIAQIGVFSILDRNNMAKEGDNLYIVNSATELNPDGQVVSGALRISNVNSTRVMTDMIETQRAYELTSDLMNNIGELENSVLNKLTK